MLTLILCSLMAVSHQIQFKFVLQPGMTQCFSEELPQNVLIYGSVSTNGTSITFSIAEVKNDQEKLLDSEGQVSEFDFHHVTDIQSKVKMCFEAEEYGAPVKIFFKYDSGSETHDFDHIAQKGQVEQFFNQISSMENLQRDISLKQQFMITQEIIRNHSFVDVSAKIIGFGGITFAMLLIVTACQIIYVKRYFAYKKLN